MDAKVRKALAAWGKEEAAVSLIAQRENIVYCAAHQGTKFALRLHRPGYQSEKMILSELAWMTHLRASGLTVPAPVPTRHGAFLHEIDGYQADLLTWLDGRPLGATGAPLDVPDRASTFHQIGALMARLHHISDDWTPPDKFERQAWDIDGLLGDAPLWGRFWENPGLSASERDRALTARAALRSDLAKGDLDFGLIHADMLRENVMIQKAGVGLIDFDDSGFGFRLFDVATALFKNRSEADYDALEATFLTGYRTIRPLDTGLLEQFMLIRALSYLGWIISRMDEPGADVRQARFLQAALPLLDAYLTR